jgi:hypothetical protein
MAWPACLDRPLGPPTAVGHSGPSRPRLLTAAWRAGPGEGGPGRRAAAGRAGCPRPGSAGRRLGRRTRWTGIRRPTALWSRPLQPRNVFTPAKVFGIGIKIPIFVQDYQYK